MINFYYFKLDYIPTIGSLPKEEELDSIKLKEV